MRADHERPAPGREPATPRAATWARITAAALLVACSSAPAPEPVPEPEPEPEPEVEVAAAPAVSRVAGRYRLTTELQRSGRGRGRRSPVTIMRLYTSPARDADSAAHVGPQYRTVVTIPGYTATGRNASRASWWPAAGDSVIVNIVQARGHRVQLRGAREDAGLRGEIWFISAETGSTYQLGTFTAARSR